MRRFGWFLCCCLPLFVAACGLAGDSPTHDTTTSVRVNRRGIPLLPKAMTAAERRKASAFKRTEGSLFALHTSAPKGNIRVPAEYEPMQGVLVRVANDETMDEFFGNMIKGILQAQAVPYLVTMDDQDQQEVTQYTLQPKGIRASQVQWIRNSIDAFWSRDYGPWHVYVDGKRTIVDMRYYPTRPYDDAISFKLGSLWTEEVHRANLYVEGGNFMTDGKGTCWTSTGIFLYNNISPMQLGALYHKYLGCKKVYTPNPLTGEGTTHLDMFSKLLNDNTIMVGTSNAAWGATAAEIESLDQAARFYASNTNVAGKPFKVIRVPMRFGTGSEGRIHYAYTNSTIVNKTVIVPLYGFSNTDDAAMQVYRKEMPGYTIYGVKGGQSIIPWGGSVHCTTMQIPTATTQNPDGKGTQTTETQQGSLPQTQWQLYGPYKAAAGDFKAILEGSGDVDLYVWKDLPEDKLTTGNFACSPFEEGSFEQCQLDGPGTFYVGLHGQSKQNTYRLSLSFNKP